MKKNLKLLVTSALIALTFSISGKIQGAEETHREKHQQPHHNNKAISVMTPAVEVGQKILHLVGEHTTYSDKMMNELEPLVTEYRDLLYKRHPMTDDMPWAKLSRNAAAQCGDVISRQHTRRLGQVEAGGHDYDEAVRELLGNIKEDLKIFKELKS